jgi:hypothetical protein
MDNFFEIWNCPDSLEFQCPQEWSSLKPTHDMDIRYCKVCSQNVYMCSTPQEFTQNAKSGKCVAIPNDLARRPQDPPVILGRPSQEEVREIEKQEKLVSNFITWWKTILTPEPSFFQTFVQKCYREPYFDHEKEFALEILEFEQFDRVIEIAKSNRSSEAFLTRIIQKLVSMGKFDVALEVAAIFEICNYKVISLNHIASELARLGQIERAVDIFEMSLQTVRSLARSSQKYEAEVFHFAALAGITLRK